MKARTVGPLMGILFVALVIASFVIGGETPDVDDSPTKIVDFYVDNDSAQIWGAVVLGWSCVALLFFVGTLRRTLRAAAGDDGGLSAVVLLGGALMAVGLTIFAGLTFTLGDAADNLPRDAVVTLNALNGDMFIPLALGNAVFNLALGLAVIRHGALPKALGWLAIVLGVASLTPAGFFAFMATGIVIIWTSVVLLRRGDGPAPAPAV
jgi:hypothetical protein